MFVAGVDHSVFGRSLGILENGDTEAEDKVAACRELEGYISHLVKNETDFVLSPFKTHGEKLMKTLLQCLEQENSKLRNSVLLVYKLALQLLPKGLGVGMQVASHCYSMLLKMFGAAGGNLEPCKSQTLVELFKYLSGFDEPQFLDAVTAATVKYTDHKELIQKCVNVCDETVDSNLEHKQDDDYWISGLRLEALRFAERLLKVCGSLLLEQFEEDLDFWLELVLPSVFVFHETYGSAVQEKVDADTRKAARQAMEAFLRLTQKNKKLKLQNWPKIKKDITDCFVDKMVKLVGSIPDWGPTWCLVLDILDGELIKRGNNHLINKLLSVIERAFKHDRSEVRVEAFVSWRHLIDKLLPPTMEVQNNAVQRSVRLLVQPLQPNNAKTDAMACQKFGTWWHLVQCLGKRNENHCKTVLVPFLGYCFGCSKSEEIPPGKKYEVLHVPCAKALANVLDHEPAKQHNTERQRCDEEVEGCVICPCEVPLLSKPAVFLTVSEELFYSVGECVVTLSGRSDVQVCSELVRKIWISLLRHITVVLDGGEIPAEKVVKVVQDLLRLLQNLTTRSSGTTPILATYCVSPLLEELVVGPHAFPPAVLASSTYYVGTAQLMTGTAALFLIEVMVSRPLLEMATSYTRYVVVLKALLDVGISHHSVLEFMHSVIRQLEIAASACHDISSAERASLCVVWSSVADALTKYLKFHVHVNQGDEKHHDLSCFYLVMLFPFYHFYSITYKQAMETLSTWLELYKCFHQAAIQNVSTLGLNEVCETVAMKICQALVRHCPTSANQAVPLLKAVQNIIMLIPFSDICGTQQSSKCKSRYLVLPDRGQISKPTNYITNTLNLVVKVSRMFSVFECTGEWYNTAGTLIMSCLETVFKNMKVGSITAAVPLMSILSDSVLKLLQVNPLQDGTTKFWHESLHRMWKCYFSFIETFVPQKSVKDFLLSWMSALLEAGFSHPQQAIRDTAVTFWDNTVVPAFAKDNTDAPEVLKEARKKCEQTRGTSCVMPDSTCNLVDDKENPCDSISAAVFAFPEETDEHPKHCQSLLQQLQNEGRILTRHQKEVFRHRKHDIPVLYSSTLQPLQEDSIISETSQDTCDFVAPHRTIEPLSTKVNVSEDEVPAVAVPLKVLEPPSSLQRLADYRKKMMIGLEGSVVLTSVSGSNSTVSTDVHDQPVLSGTSPGILDTQTETQRAEQPSSPLSLALVSHPCEPIPLPSNGRKLDLEAVAVRLPAAIVVPSEVTPELPNTQLVHDQDVTAKPEVAITVPVSTPVLTSVAESVNDAPFLFPLEEPAVCSSLVVATSEQELSVSCNVLASPLEVQKIVECPAAPQAFLTYKDLSPKASDVTSIVPASRKSLLIEATSKNTSTVSMQKVDPATKSKRKPAAVVINTENPLTNYFRPVSITLTADDDEVDTSGKGNARTIHLSVENSGDDSGTMASGESESCLHSLEATQIVPEHTEALAECLAPSLPCVEVRTVTKENDKECAVTHGMQVLSPLKVVVEKVEDFIVTKAFSALETTPPLNIEHKEVPSCGVSSCCRRKPRCPLKRHAGDPKLPPFKGCSKRVQQIKTRKQYKEVLLQDKLSESRSRHSKRKGSENPTTLKCPSQVRGHNKHGSDDQVLDLTGQEAVSGSETTSGDNTSPSLLPAASGRTSSKTKLTKSTNTISKAIENNVAVQQNDELLKLSTTGSQPKQILNSATVLDGVNTKKRSSKRHKPLNTKDLTYSRQVRNCNFSHDKGQAFDVESSKQNVACSRGLSNTSAREDNGDTCGNGSSSSASNGVVDEVAKQNIRNSAELLKPHVEMRETVQKVIKPNSCRNKMSLRSANKDTQNVKMMNQNMLCKTNVLKSDSDPQRSNVEFTKQNISNNNYVFSVGLREVQVNDTEMYKQNTVNCKGSVQHVQGSDVQISERSLSNSNKSLGAGIENETLLGSKAPNYMGTSEHDACGMVKGSPEGITEKVCESTDSHKQSERMTSNVCVDKGPVKCVSSEVCYTPGAETSVSCLRGKRKFSSSDTGLKPSTAVRKPTSKCKRSMTLTGSNGKEINHSKPADNGSQTACNLRMDQTSDTRLVPEAVSAERNVMLLAGMTRGKRTRSKAKDSDSLILAESVYSKRRKVKPNETGFQHDLDRVRVSRHECESSHDHQCSINPPEMEDKSLALLGVGGKSSLSKSPEMLVVSTGGIIVSDEMKTAAVLTPGEVSAVTVPVLAAIVTGRCSGEVTILPTKTSVIPESPKRDAEEKIKSVQSCEDQAIGEVISVTVHGSNRDENFTLEKGISGEKVISRQKSPYTTSEENERLLGTGPCQLCPSTNKLGEHVKDKISLDVTDCNFTSMLRLGKLTSSRVPDNITHTNVNDRCRALDHLKESDVQVAQNQVLEKNSMIELGLKASVQAEGTCSCISVQAEGTCSCISTAEVTVPRVQVQNASASPHAAHTDSTKPADSEDVIESSQDSSASSFVHSRLPLLQKCSVSVCRIDTTLEPGAKIIVSDGDCRLIVCAPEGSSSSFKVCTIDKGIPASGTQEKLTKAVSGVGKAHGMTCCSANQSLYGKHADVTGMDSVQDKPSVSLGINSSRDERIKEPEVCVSEYADSIQTSRNEPQEGLRRQEGEDSVLSVVKTDAANPQSEQAPHLSKSKEYSPVVMDNISRSTFRHQISIAKHEGNSVVSKHESEDQTITSDNNISTADICDTPKVRSKEGIMTPANNVSRVGKEVTPRLKSREQIITSEKNISRFGKEGTVKHQYKHQINTSLSEGNISTVNHEHTPELRSKHQVNSSKSEHNSSTIGKEDTPKPQSREESDVSVSEDNILVVGSKEILKQRANEMFSASKSEDCTLPCCKEDGPKPHSSQGISTSQSEDSVSKEEKENIRKPQSKRQLSAADSNDNHMSSVTYDTQECHSKQKISKSALEDAVLTAVSENTSKLKRKSSFISSNCDINVSTLLKEDIPNPEPEQQKSEACGLTTIKEGRLKPRTRPHTVALKSEGISLAEDLKARFRHHVNTFKIDSTVVAVIPESQSEQQITMLKPKDQNTTVMKDNAEKSELNSSNCEEIAAMCITDDTAELRPKHAAMDRRIKSDTRVKNYSDRRGTKFVLRSSSERMLTGDEVTIDRPQQLVAPKSVSTNQCQRNSDEQTKDDNVYSVDPNSSSQLDQQKISDYSGFVDDTSGTKKTPLNESNVLEGDFNVPSPLQSCKRPASLEVPCGQAASSLDNPADIGASKINKFPMKNAENVSLCEKSVCGWSVAAPLEVKLCDDASSDSDKTPSPPSSKSLIRSPSSLLRAFCSVLGSAESSESNKSHHKRSRGRRAHYLLDRAVAVKDIETWSDVRPEQIRSVHSGTQPSLPLSRKIHLYTMSGGDSSPQEMLEGSVPKCETPSLACVTNLANVTCKRALKLAFSEQGVHPSKKKRVWFPDPELSSIRYYDSGPSSSRSTHRRCSPHVKTRRPLGKRRKAGECHAAVSSDSSVQDESPVRAFSTGPPDTESPHGKGITPESQSSPDLSGLASQGSVNETATELLNSQDAFFPPLVNCSHPIECIAPRLTTKLEWTKALIVELTHKNIRTIGDLSRLDEASINRLPLAGPKIPHAKAVLQDYMKLLEVESETSQNVRGGVSEDDADLASESIPSSALSTETHQISVADFLKSIASKRENLGAQLKEVSKVWGQYGQGLLQEEILCLLPVQSLVQHTVSRLVSDTSCDIPASDYQKFMDAIAKRVTHTEFTALFYNAVMANSAQNKFCP